MTLPGSAKTFGSYAQIFAESILKELRSDTLRRIDVVFDRYFQDTLKSDTLEKKGSGIRISVKATTPICSNWRQFLRVNENKEELFSLLTKQLGDSSVTGKLIVATSAEDIKCSSILNTETLFPSNHEEADTRIFLHAKHAADKGHRLVSIRTVDTDVVVIAIYVFRKLQITDEDFLSLERYVILIYDRASTLQNVNECCKALFSKKGRSIDALPPSRDALIQHSRRALLQGGYRLIMNIW